MSTWPLKDDESAKSWGTPYQHFTAPVSSPSSTWGTFPTTISSTSSLQAVIDHKSSWNPQTNVAGPPQGWAAYCSPPLYPSPLSTSAGVSTYGGYSFPPPLLSPSPSRLSPLLDSRSPRCIEFDIGYPVNYIPDMNEPAVQPPVTFMQLFIVVQPFKWHVKIQVPGLVSVYHIIQQLHEFLQGYHNMQDLQKRRVTPSGYTSLPQSSTNFREQSTPNGFHSGQKRIDLLGRHRIFRGLSPDHEPNAWVVHLSDR